jgi:hypothetical protein
VARSTAHPKYKASALSLSLKQERLPAMSCAAYSAASCVALRGSVIKARPAVICSGFRICWCGLPRSRLRKIAQIVAVPRPHLHRSARRNIVSVLACLGQQPGSGFSLACTTLTQTVFHHRVIGSIMEVCVIVCIAHTARRATMSSRRR